MFRRKSKKEKTVEARQKRLASTQSSKNTTQRQKSFWLNHKAMFCVIAILATVICFFGQTPKEPFIQAGQISRDSLIADFDFNYKSDIRTKDLISKRKEMIAPAYMIEMDSYIAFEKQSVEFLDFLNNLEKELDEKEDKKNSSNDWAISYNKEILEKFNLHMNNENLALLINDISSTKRKKLIDEGMQILQKIMQAGIYDSSLNGVHSDVTAPYIVNLETNDESPTPNVESEENALRKLNSQLSALRIDTEISQTLFIILKNGLQPNLVYDQERSNLRLLAVEKSVPPVIVKVNKWQHIISAGNKVTPEQAEQATAYHNEIHKKEDYESSITLRLTCNVLVTFCIFIIAIISANMGFPRLDKPIRQIKLIAMILISNLILIRIIQESGASYVIKNLGIIELMPYATPIALGAMLAAIFINTQAGIQMAVIICVFNALMYNYSIYTLTLLLLAPITGVFLCRKVRSRRKIIHSAVITGLIVAGYTVITGIIDNIPFVIVAEQSMTSVVTGFSIGIIIICVIPLLERMFNLTTNIKLHELADYNHQLLRQMQLMAPGSYHHSLMVANLAERAAAEIGANGLLCRTCSLYHDIGKIMKPEYFTENQVDGINPHMKKNPSMSALVIKSHIKEAANMAKEAKLPEVIVDTIERHHGTGLIWYFYHRAKKEKLETEGITQSSNGGDVEESTYRYDGPKPQSREDAIILLADSVEAASRSLQKPSASNIEELVDKIFKTHIDDGQLNESPITMGQIDQVKKAFVVTLLNTMHQRTVYPDREDSKKQNGKKKDVVIEKEEPKETSPKKEEIEVEAEAEEDQAI